MLEQRRRALNTNLYTLAPTISLLLFGPFLQLSDRLLTDGLDHGNSDLLVLGQRSRCSCGEEGLVGAWTLLFQLATFDAIRLHVCRCLRLRCKSTVVVVSFILVADQTLLVLSELLLKLQQLLFRQLQAEEALGLLLHQCQLGGLHLRCWSRMVAVNWSWLVLLQELLQVDVLATDRS
jgi:hypothetical protein